MDCFRCHVPMNSELLDDEITRHHSETWRVRRECPKCHVRVYQLVKVAKKND